jgi:hypothetical protein
MRRFSYEGDKGEVVLYGVTFPRSEPVAVDPAAHPVLVGKLAGNSHFREHGPSEPTAAEADTVESLRARLDAAGIEYDKRWGLKRLQELLPE